MVNLMKNLKKVLRKFQTSQTFQTLVKNSNILTKNIYQLCESNFGRI